MVFLIALAWLCGPAAAKAAEEEPSAASATLLEIALNDGGAGAISSTLPSEPAPGAASATPFLGTKPGVSSTTANNDISVAGIQVRNISIKGTQEATLILPEGNARVVIENRLGRSLVRMGGHYDFYNGLIETWVTYGHLLWKKGPLLQVSASDHIGLGQLYFRQRSLERTREIPVAVGQQFAFGSVLLSASRASWLLAPVNAPATAEQGLIDSIGIQVTATDKIPDIAEHLEGQRPGTTAVEYRRAFRDFSGDFGFERVSVDLYRYLPGIRSPDEVQLRAYGGQAYSIRSNRTATDGASNTLPIRETFALGGASTLKGYQPGEFRGRGILVLGTEYALVTPWNFRMHLVRLTVWESSVLFFMEEGRIQASWQGRSLVRGEPMKWSAGMGLRFRGKVMNSHTSIVRLYMAQSGDYPARGPVFYALVDIADL